MHHKSSRIFQSLSNLLSLMCLFFPDLEVRDTARWVLSTVFGYPFLTWILITWQDFCCTVVYLKTDAVQDPWFFVKIVINIFPLLSWLPKAIGVCTDM